ncbi:MAG TPA: hypothetical protein VFG50_11920, partial [Rhodothermales bacterium]|nr:hypothetical protein [Rhodothermales bacterium]
MTRILLFLSLTSVLFAGAAFAQDNGQGNQPALPEIAPNEVEIRGQLDPSLPSLQRQPLTGFGRPEHVAGLPPEREPYAETYEQANLPQSPLRGPEPPDISSLVGKPPVNGEFEASAGRYFSRVVKGYTALPASDKTSFYGRVEYEGSDGFVPAGGAPDITSEYDDMKGGVGVQTIFSRLIGGVEFDGLFNKYALYGASLSSERALPVVPDRSGKHGAGSLWLRSHGDTRTQFQARATYGGTRFETTASDGSTTISSTQRDEQLFSLTSDVQAPIPGGKIFGALDFGTATLNDGNGNTGVQTVDAGGGFRFFYRQNIALTLGAQLLNYAVDPGGASKEQHTYFSPDVRLEIYPAHGIQLYARNAPGIERNTLASLFETNPFLRPSPEVEPTVKTINAEAGAGLFFGPVRIQGRAGYQRMPNYLYFERSPFFAGDSYTGLIQARYGKAQVAYAGGDLSVVLPGGFQATIGGTVRDGSLENADVDFLPDDPAPLPPGESTIIPYFGPITGHGILSY